MDIADNAILMLLDPLILALVLIGALTVCVAVLGAVFLAAAKLVSFIGERDSAPERR